MGRTWGWEESWITADTDSLADTFKPSPRNWWLFFHLNNKPWQVYSSQKHFSLLLKKWAEIYLPDQHQLLTSLTCCLPSRYTPFTSLSSLCLSIPKGIKRVHPGGSNSYFLCLALWAGFLRASDHFGLTGTSVTQPFSNSSALWTCFPNRTTCPLTSRAPVRRHLVLLPKNPFTCLPPHPVSRPHPPSRLVYLGMSSAGQHVHSNKGEWIQKYSVPLKRPTILDQGSLY